MDWERLLGSSYNNYIHSTNININIDPSNRPNPEALNLVSFTGNSAHDRSILFIVCSFQYVFLSGSDCLLKHMSKLDSHSHIT